MTYHYILALSEIFFTQRLIHVKIFIRKQNEKNFVLNFSIFMLAQIRSGMLAILHCPYIKFCKNF